MSTALRIGVLWCCFFHRSGSEKWWWRLREAYRPPSLFASRMRAGGHDVEVLVCDEELKLTDLDGSGGRNLADDVDLLYVMSHGTFSANNGYAVMLEAADWVPSLTGLGGKRLSVAVFDTCWLIDSQQNWQHVWAQRLGSSVNLILGFDGPAAIDRAAALRGNAFAQELLNGNTFADAWLQAVHSTTMSQYSKAVAIGVGDNQAAAANVLNSARLTAIPPPRQGAAPFFELKR